MVRLRKLIRANTEEDDDAIWAFIVETGCRVVDLGHRLYDFNELALAQLACRNIGFTVIEPEEWRWQDGVPSRP